MTKQKLLNLKKRWIAEGYKLAKKRKILVENRDDEYIITLYDEDGIEDDYYYVFVKGKKISNKEFQKLADKIGGEFGLGDDNLLIYIEQDIAEYDKWIAYYEKELEKITNQYNTYKNDGWNNDNIDRQYSNTVAEPKFFIKLYEKLKKAGITSSPV